MSIELIVCLFVIVVLFLTILRWGRDCKGFLGLGTVLGLMLGLSSSPILAGFISGMVTVACLLIPKFLPPVSAKTGETEPNPSPDMTGFQLCMYAFTSTLCVGLLLGITMRVNDTLNLRQDLRSHYRTMGFSEKQITDIMASHAESFKKRKIEVPTKAPSNEHTNLQRKMEPAKLKKLLSDTKFPGDTSKQHLKRVLLAIGETEKHLIAKLNEMGTPAIQVLNMLETWAENDDEGKENDHE